jgi:hypothetical protein
MKTDQAIYTYLRTGAEAFRILTGGLRLSGPYRFRSITFKAIERRADGVCEPEAGNVGSSYVVEFQAQPKDTAWYNLMTKVGLIGEELGGGEIVGILVFLHEGDDPPHPTGITTPGAPFRAVYLNRILPDLLAQEPDNPYVVVFAPLVVERDEALRAQAPRLWRTLQSADIPEPDRLNLAEVLEFWFMERFRDLTPEEVFAMLHQLTPLEETRSYKIIFGRGESKGKAEGKADSLERLLRHRFGPLPDWASARIAAANLSQLDAWLDAVLDIDGIEELLGPAP